MVGGMGRDSDGSTWQTRVDVGGVAVYEGGERKQQGQQEQYVAGVLMLAASPCTREVSASNKANRSSSCS
jgi:hypothetical protein